MDPKEAGLLVKSVVVPRPIAWVGSVAGDGTPNLAPHSYFTMVSADPPMVIFVSAGRKDTLRNVEATGEFTVSVVSAALAEQSNSTSAPWEPDVDEFRQTPVAPRPSAAVRAPGVAGSPAVLECVLDRVVAAGDGFTVFGRVVHVSVAEEVLTEDSHGRSLPDTAAMDPVTRLGRNEWAHLGEVFAVDRPTDTRPS